MPDGKCYDKFSDAVCSITLNSLPKQPCPYLRTPGPSTHEPASVSLNIRGPISRIRLRPSAMELVEKTNHPHHTP